MMFGGAGAVCVPPEHANTSRTATATDPERTIRCSIALPRRGRATLGAGSWILKSPPGRTRAGADARSLRGVAQWVALASAASSWPRAARSVLNRDTQRPATNITQRKPKATIRRLLPLAHAFEI